MKILFRFILPRAVNFSVAILRSGIEGVDNESN